MYCKSKCSSVRGKIKKDGDDDDLLARLSSDELDDTMNLKSIHPILKRRKHKRQMYGAQYIGNSLIVASFIA